MFDTKRLPDLLAGLFIGLVVLFMAFPFESFSGSLPGHMMGIVGTILMFLALLYPFRKRILKKKGKQNPLTSHIYFGLLGSSLVVVHSGHKHESTIGMLLFIAMLLVVLSGIVGKMLYAKVNRTLRGHKADLEMLIQFFRDRKKTIGGSFDDFRLILEREDEPGLENENEDHMPKRTDDSKERAKYLLLKELAEAMADKESTILVFSKTQKYFSFWHNVHIFSIYFLFAMVSVHVLTTLYYGLRWLP